ncbi:transcription initiation factor TFIID subunit 4b isoform X2 [Aristolochia californica]|uniref:transcription initiation factor TFIID subunit 4b isoform X2 n=1 Tax=Aristolochia californica TaxID=171875 RepID=UPI0035D719A1
MDPSIMKILEDDEPDESQYSGADIDAISAELNRDIGGDVPASQPSDSENGVLGHGGNSTSSQLLEQWKGCNQEEHITNQNQQEKSQDHVDAQGQLSSEVGPTKNASGSESQTLQNNCSLEQDQHPLHQSQNNQTAPPLSEKSHQVSEQSQVQISEPSSVQLSEQEGRLQASQTQPLQVSKQSPMSNQVPLVAEQTNSPMRRNKSTPNISFAMLIPVLRPHLDKDRNMQLETIFTKLRRNEVTKEDFLRVVRNIVGDQMLRFAAQKVQMRQQAQVQAAQNSQTNPLPYQPESQASGQQLTAPTSSAQQFSDAQHTQPSPVSASTAKMQTDTFTSQETSAQMSREAGIQLETQGMRVNQVVVKTERESSMASLPPVNKQQQQHLHLQPTSFPMYGGTTINNYNPHGYSGPSVPSGPTSLKPQTQESQLRQVQHLQGSPSTQLIATQPMSLVNTTKYEIQNNMNETKRLHGGSIPHLNSPSPLQQNSTAWLPSLNREQKIDQATDQQQKPPHLLTMQRPTFGTAHSDQGNSAPGPSKDEGAEKQAARVSFPSPTGLIATSQISGPVTTPTDPSMQMRSHIPSATTPAATGTNVRTPPKKPTVGQKKPLEAGGTPSPLSSKKQKVSGALLDQSIEQLNDVTAVSGVNLREEEEQLLAAPKEESRASEATRKVVQEEEERLILQKGPLQKKIAEIMSKCGIKSTSNDVERCLSLCVEERMRGLISSLIRISKQRIDLEKPRHRYFVTSDVKRQILMMNRKAKEDWDKKQAEEAEKQRKLNETEGTTGADVDKDKEEGRAKTVKVNKEEDDKMRTTAANVAARAAVGGDDMFQKWQLMAEQARQKREGGLDGSSSSQSGKDPSRSLSASGRSLRGENQSAENRGSSVTGSSGAMRKFGRNPVGSPPLRVARSISIKDVITVLEREPQMSKSTMIYRLYERVQANGAPE